MAKSAKTRQRPQYVPCKEIEDRRHKFERITHNIFEKCMHCGEPRFALLQAAGSPEQVSAEPSLDNHTVRGP